MKRFLFIVLVFTMIGYSLNAQTDKISVKLEKTLIHTSVEEALKVWVYFTDKGGNDNLDLIKSNLTDRSKRRREKVMGQKLVDKYDIPIYSEYINVINPYVNKLVVKSKWLNAVSVEMTPENIENV